MDATYTRYSAMSLTMMGLSLLLNYTIVFTNIPFLHKLPSSSFLIVFLCFGDCLTTSNVVALTMTQLIEGSLEYDAQTFCRVLPCRDQLVLCCVLFTSIHAGISAGILRNASVWNQLH
ncbi:hypothetical protein BJ741DRAFT_610170, partial [Chytriomyces cf. hyalinus JEL632]